MELRSFTVEAEEALSRLDVFLSRRLQGEFSREKIKRRILEGMALVDGQLAPQPGRELLAGQKVELALPEMKAGPKAEDGELQVLYQDEDLAVLNKPAGLSVHPSPGEPSGTLLGRLLAHFPALTAQGGDRPGLVHRLDKDTSGLMLIALNEGSRLAMSAAFAGRLPRKEYLALVYGRPAPLQGVIEAPLGRHSRQKTKMAVLPKGGRPARSDYRTLYSDPSGRFSLLAVRIHTGRTHQIRVHLAHIGHPVIGDGRYAQRPAAARALDAAQLSPAQEEFLRGLAQGQLLHAWQLDFPHPGELMSQGLSVRSPSFEISRETAPLHFACPPPDRFIQAALALSGRLQRLVITGNPGCGKSSLLKILRNRGLPVWSADQSVARLYEPGADGWRIIRKRFGNRFIPEQAESGSVPLIDKKALFAAMAADQTLRREVEGLIHPLVLAEQEHFFQNLDVLPLAAPLAAVEVPLYFESRLSAKTGQAGAAGGEGRAAPLVAAVRCPLDIRAQRLKRNRGWSAWMIAQMEGWQWPEEKKYAAADFIVDNSGPPDALEAEADKLVSSLEKRRAEIRAVLEKKLREICSPAA
ncbi:MAG: dephospho-CoA kinase [Desulfovibrionaceae bacterium]|nr:dephospho-CoA kinase [Desulfovibrionaceae bacterium]